MKNLFILCAFAVLLQSCGLNNQARQIEALKNCVYEIQSADSIYIAGRDVSKLIKNRTFELSNLPELAIAMFRKNIPFSAKVNLNIKNPGTKTASINQFEYIILLKDQELASGFVNQKVRIEPNESSTVPVRVNSNLYSFLSNGKTIQELMAFMNGGESDATERKGILTIKIRPSFELGKDLIKYPGYITIEKELSSKILF